MKKLVVLALVLGIVGFASASLSMTPNAVVSPTFVTITGAGNGLSGAGGYLFTVGGTIDAGTMIFTGNKAEILVVTDPDVLSYFTDTFGAFNQLISFNFTDTTGLVLANGDLAKFNAISPVTVTMTNGDGEQVGGPVNLVPEPVTMLLLGLGGLFLRKR